MITRLIVRQKEVFSGMKLREARTFYLHLGYSILDGFILGVLALNEFIFLKDIGANTLLVGILFQMTAFVMPFSIFLTYFVSRVRDKRRLLMRIGLITRLPLLLFFFFPAHPAGLGMYKHFFIWIYLLIFTLYFLASPVILPVLNLFTKSIYRPNRFGRLFSYTLIVNQLILLLATIFFGKLLDWRADSYRFIFPLCGLLGLYAIYLVTKIPYKEPKKRELPKGPRFWRTVGRIYRDAVFILTKEKAFFDFERSMMLYGMGFMMSLAVITVYLSSYFNLSYSDIAFYKNIPIFISIVSFPVFGRIMDEGDPRKFAIVSFFFVMLYFICLILGGIFPEHAFLMGKDIIPFILLAYIVHGLYSASMALIWGIGATYFAPIEEAARFHAVHVSLTGVRGIIGPVLGVIIYKLLGFYGAFGCCILLEVAAIYTMRKSVKNVKGRIS